MKVIIFGAEKESFSEQERFVWMEITFTLRKNGRYRAIRLGGRSFPVVKLAGRLVSWLMKISLFRKI